MHTIPKDRSTKELGKYSQNHAYSNPHRNMFVVMGVGTQIHDAVVSETRGLPVTQGERDKRRKRWQRALRDLDVRKPRHLDP